MNAPTYKSLYDLRRWMNPEGRALRDDALEQIARMREGRRDPFMTTPQFTRPPIQKRLKHTVLLDFRFDCGCSQVIERGGGVCWQCLRRLQRDREEVELMKQCLEDFRSSQLKVHALLRIQEDLARMKKKMS